MQLGAPTSTPATSRLSPPRALFWNGNDLFAAFSAAAVALAANQTDLNGLNVFPVPDGDTGNNMVLTMRGAVAEASALPPDQRIIAHEVATRVKRGALMQAQGNSGVILSQMLRGFAESLDGAPELDGAAFARALRGASDHAYRAVLEPVEGTMLTVIRAAAEGAGHAAARGGSFDDIATAALDAAELALARTPEQLSTLRLAGVVDAGGLGAVHLLRAFQWVASGSHPGHAPPTETHRPISPGWSRPESIEPGSAAAYCANFMIFGSTIPFQRLRSDLAVMGESAVIVGDGSVVKVHIHTNDPDRLLDDARAFGELRQINIENMREQIQARRTGACASSPSTVEIEGIEVIALAPGDGIARVLRSLGATAVVIDGDAALASARIAEKIAASKARHILILPSSASIRDLIAAAPRSDDRDVRVIETGSVPQIIAALSAFNHDADAGRNVAAMSAAATRVRSVTITASRSEHRYTGLIEGEPAASSGDVIDTTIRTLMAANAAGAELISLFTGRDLAPDLAQRVVNRVEASFEHAVVEVHAGGQRDSLLIISVE